MKKRILLMLKLSEFVDTAFKTALKMAADYQARLHILYVLDHRLRNPGITDAQVAKITKEAESRFVETYLPCLKGFRSYYFNCWEGDPANETAKLAEEINADFIILGCHRRDGQPSFNRLGEVGLAILQWAPCPVMLVPCDIDQSDDSS